jgi:tetratricopeptide (TPR) repeat protein
MRRLHQLSAALALAALVAVASVADATAPVASGTDVDSVGEQIEKGDELVAVGKFGAARKAYEKAAELSRSAGELPTRSLRRIANAFYFEGRYRSAANVLDGLTDEAATFGDLPAQAWALADAAWLYGKMGSGLEVDRRLERLERLLTSEYLPDVVRDRIATARLDGTTTLGLR